jgi:NifU-like protein involved in Fe-S cluster formation
MSSPVYTNALLQMALNLADYLPLDAPHIRVERRAVPCGSTIILDMKFDHKGIVNAVGMKVSACAFGQASAAIMAKNIIGKGKADIDRIVCDLYAWLADENVPLPDWPDMDMLVPARPYPARHGAILLPFQAAAQAYLGSDAQDVAA